PGSNIYRVDEQLIYDWATTSYGLAGCYSFAQMEFNDGKMHLAYLGLVDGSPNNSGCWLRHPYYTSRDKDGNWTQTQYIVNSLDYIDLEFAYLTSAGFSDDVWYLMAQVDSYAGVHECYGQGCTPEHDPVKNTYYFFPYGEEPYIPSIGDIEYAPLNMSVIPNPASGQVTVKFEGKGNITVYNMLGQTVYHVENVENNPTIPLNMASGVYFVTVRSENATATQKLIVK
ncbi:MAG: T9SS type A sorting domain-containing protein, partial [Bacteroidales bacterium]|nr:T9SS type A sorting domain-containing protein [Bacteroidales bacterium]